MRNITKILLLVVVGFIVYLVLPRTPNLKGFEPGALATLEVKDWRAQKGGKGFASLMAQYKIYSSQYHFSPMTAFRIAQNQGDALENLKIAAQSEADSAEEIRALAAMTEKYAQIKASAKASFEADAMARDEIAWRTLEIKNAAPEVIVPPITRIFAGLYGGQPSDFNDVAFDLLDARAAIFKDPAPEGVDAQATAVEGYKLLKEIATTSPGASATPAP